MLDFAHPARLVARAFDYPHGHVVSRHDHAEGQFLYATRGVLAVTTDAGAWSLSPRTALWLPAGVAHEVRAVGPVGMRTAYADSEAFRSLPARACVLEVSALLQALISRAAARAAEDDLGPTARLLGVLEDEIRSARVAPLPLPLPTDPRARAVAMGLLAHPADRRTLEQWGPETGAGGRTLARLFRDETGLSFGAWRTRVRILRALELLARGRPVKTIPSAVGYNGPGAFVAMFRRTMGFTPGAWARAAREDDRPDDPPPDSEQPG